MKKVLFFSAILMGMAFCYAQENVTHNKDVCPKSMLENIEEVDYDCLDILDGRLEKEIDEEYKILYQRVKRIKILPYMVCRLLILLRCVKLGGSIKSNFALTRQMTLI